MAGKAPKKTGSKHRSRPGAKLGAKTHAPPTSDRKRTRTRPSKGAVAMKVRVRMYRQGLGDCFLVTFDPDGNARHMLIDCGSLGATTTKLTLSKVVAEIKSATNDHLDLVVVTHEHIDHLKAFGTEREVFAKIPVDRVWLAWTENPKDQLAQSLAKTQEDLGQALGAAAQMLGAAPDGSRSKSIGDSVHDLLGFFVDPELKQATKESVGPEAARDPQREGAAREPAAAGAAPDPKPLAAAKFASGLNDTMEFVRTGLQGAKTEYLKPGCQPDVSAWLPGFRFYVLGPPRSMESLKDTGEHGSSELYGMAAALHTGAAPDALSAAAVEHELPFDPSLRIPKEHRLVRSWYGKSYFEAASDWRRVDQDWLHVAADLALQLDNVTNNTSLVLAIERIADGKVLLFPADAQQGNWLSWQDPELVWKVAAADGKTHDVTANDLLARTVFYKVGHHSSHNATAKEQGLERMANESELVAFIPVDRAVALKKSPAGSWQMPARSLYRRLLEKCQGRVVRSDLGWATDATTAADKDVEMEFVGMATAAEWQRWNQAQQTAEDVEKRVIVEQEHIDFFLA